MKRTLKRITLFLLSAASALSLTACGISGTTTDRTSSDAGTSDTGIGAPDPAKASLVLCIDAGHGVGDVGAVSPFVRDGESETYEKDINLELVLYLADELRALGYTVVLPRGADEEEPAAGYGSDGKCRITQRVTWANAQGHDLYVSIHCNSFTDPSVHGTRLYYNKGNNGSVNKTLASAISDSLLRFSGVEPKTVRDADLYAVTATKMPAILIENGFITNQEDFANMTDSRWQQQFAKAVAEGIDDFLVSEHKLG